MLGRHRLAKGGGIASERASVLELAGGLPLEYASGRAAGVSKLGQSLDKGPATELAYILKGNL